MPVSACVLHTTDIKFFISCSLCCPGVARESTHLPMWTFSYSDKYLQMGSLPSRTNPVTRNVLYFFAKSPLAISPLLNRHFSGRIIPLITYYSWCLNNLRFLGNPAETRVFGIRRLNRQRSESKSEENPLSFTYILVLPDSPTETPRFHSPSSTLLAWQKSMQPFLFILRRNKTRQYNFLPPNPLFPQFFSDSLLIFLVFLVF